MWCVCHLPALQHNLKDPGLTILVSVCARTRCCRTPVPASTTPCSRGVTRSGTPTSGTTVPTTTVRTTPARRDGPRLATPAVRAGVFGRSGVAEVAGRVRQRAGDSPIYVSVDIDVLNPVRARNRHSRDRRIHLARAAVHWCGRCPATRCWARTSFEVNPPFDHAEISSLAGRGHSRFTTSSP